MSESARSWFPAKRYGWGWGMPVTWQGWAVLGVFAVLVSTGFLLFPPAQDVALFLLYVAVLCGLLCVICYVKGERTLWRWGGK